MWYRFCQTVINQAVKLPDGSVVIPRIVAENKDNDFYLKKLTGGLGYANLKPPLKPSTTQTNSPTPALSATRSTPPAMPPRTNPAPTNNFNPQQTNQKTLPQRGVNETEDPNKYKLETYLYSYKVKINNGIVKLTGIDGKEFQSQVFWMPGTNPMQILRDMKENFNRYLIPQPPQKPAQKPDQPPQEPVNKSIEKQTEDFG